MNADSYANMDEEAYRTAYLIAGYIRNTLTEQEHQELDDWVTASDHNMQLFEDLTDEKNLEANLEWMDQVQTQESFRKLQESGAFIKPAKRQTRIVWTAAASIVLIAGVLFLYRSGSNSTGTVLDLAKSDTALIRPGGNRATLTLSDGSVIDLATVSNGSIEIGNGAHVRKPADGELVYDDGVPDGTPSIHTLSTPVGGQYQVTLPDGTRVWLNAATRLQYPSRFDSSERKVEIDGEAYFEVAKSEGRPFRVVLKDSVSVTVLGTHFNIMAYPNENTKKISLLQGKIAVRNRDKINVLNPGMQAGISNRSITITTDIDYKTITGWKDGLFVFRDASIQSIMKQVERWYDVKVIYQGEIKQEFNATIRRDEPLSKLLRLLELNGYVKFKTEKNIIYVLP